MSRRKLEGEVLTDYADQVKAEIGREAARLGLDAGSIINGISAFSAAVTWENRHQIRAASTAWGASVTLSVCFKPDEASYLGFIAECDLGWSATGRSVSQAVHVIALYQRAVEMAAIIEGVVR